MSQSHVFLKTVIGLVILTIACEADELVNGDFVIGTLAGWNASGMAFSTSPLDKDPGPGWKYWEGKYYVNAP